MMIDLWLDILMWLLIGVLGFLVMHLERRVQKLEDRR